jgi:hypothetical protein
MSEQPQRISSEDLPPLKHGANYDALVTAQPQRSEQEWTPEWVRDTAAGAGIVGENYAVVLANYHNAELAAERDAFAAKNPTSFVRIERVQELLDADRQDIVRLEGLLAAEQEKRGRLVRGLHRLYALRDLKCDEQAKRAYDAAFCAPERKVR